MMKVSFPMSHHKPKPLMTSVTDEKLCPVCGELSYSKDGIHPGTDFQSQASSV